MTTKYIMGLVAKGKTTVGGNSTVLQIWGLYHLVGSTVSAFICGGDAGDFTVAADGSIDVPMSTTDATALANLIANNGTYGEMECLTSVTSASVETFIKIPVVVGVGFVSQGQVLRAATETDVKSSTGAALGKKRRVHQIAALFQESLLPQLGTSLTPSALGNMIYAHFSQTPDEEVTIALAATFSGVYRVAIEDNSGYDGMFCWQQARPWPTTICSVSSFIFTEDDR